MGHLVNRFGLPADLFHGVADREQVDEECEGGEKPPAINAEAMNERVIRTKAR